MDIGFKDEIPDDFKTADGFAKIIDKHSNHPSIIKFRENIQTLHHFFFTAVNDKYTQTNIYLCRVSDDNTRTDILSADDIFECILLNEN